MTRTYEVTIKPEPGPFKEVYEADSEEEAKRMALDDCPWTREGVETVQVKEITALTGQEHTVKQSIIDAFQESAVPQQTEEYWDAAGEYHVEVKNSDDPHSFYVQFGEDGSPGIYETTAVKITVEQVFP